ncbi:MAG: amidohydrolase family protein [Candidatus Thorarchaeota archaeon]
MQPLIIKNGLVFDPLNDMKGEKKDILIENGKIVEKFSSKRKFKEIDANRKTVIPAALDIHTHIASQQVNWARLLGSNNKLFQKIWKGLTLDNIAKDYISKGYTFILEANVFPSLTKQTIFNFNHLPVLDKAMLLNVSNLWPLELEFQRGKIEDMAVFFSDLLSITKGFGLKVYNPFESENWNFKSLRKDISGKGRLYNFSALDVYENSTKANEHLGLPHSIHAHIEGYESLKAKNNLFTILNKIISLNLEPNSKINSKIKRSQIFHIAHASAYNIDGNNAELINLLNSNDNINLDLGFIGFNRINPIITADRRLIDSLLKIDNNDTTYKLIRAAVEFEGDIFATFRNFDKNNITNCYLWANALDIALNVKNIWQLQFSINFPNYANITDIPEIATWLVSKSARDDFMKDMSREFLKDNPLTNNDKTTTFNEFIILTRASPAKSLGLGNIKGNLGVGSDADINILDLNISEIDISKDFNSFKNALGNIEYVIKAGNIIKEKEKFDFSHQGSIFWSQGKPEKEDNLLTMKNKREFYQKFSSIFYDSLKISTENSLLREIK